MQLKETIRYILGMFAAVVVKDTFPFLTNKRLLLPLLLISAIFLLFTAARLNVLDTSFIHKVNEILVNKDDMALQSSPSLAVDHRRRLAAIIAEIQLEIHRLAGKKATINAKWSIKLAAIAEELDPRLALTTKSSWDFSARLPDMGPAPQPPNGTRHVCPEVYFGSRYGSPYSHHGMEPENCSYVQEFESVLTAVLPAFTWTPSTVNLVIKQIRKYHNVPILALVSSTEGIDDDYQSVSFELFTEGSDQGKFMNEKLQSVSTPYVFFATSLAHFTNQSSLERLVRVLDELDYVKVAGGAARDLDGQWIHGCLQSRMANYQAFYTLGYYYSKYECMYCDDLITPFVTSKKTLKDLQFTPHLSGSALYRDWFAKLRVMGFLTMVCPDVMFFVSSHANMMETDWLAVAKKWSLERITSFDGKQYNFSCESVGITCKNPLGIIKSYLLPPCCVAKMEKYLGILTKYGRDHNLNHELQAGSALGAVKMGGYLPWDYDTDIVFECKDFSAWMAADKVLKAEGCHPSIHQRNKYITVYCPNFFLELYCHQFNLTSSQYLPVEYQNIPTTIQYSGNDVIVNANPALHTRNRMGFDDLKHAAHWRTLKVSEVGKAKGGYEKPGTWNPCVRPTHHSCLDHYPGDGNLPFLQPFLLL